MRLRTHGIVTPACGLAGYGDSQAVRALRIAREMADRIGDYVTAPAHHTRRTFLGAGALALAGLASGPPSRTEP